MKVAVCAVGKMENHYIREWVEHYKGIDVDKIFLYDNNDIDGERFDEVIADYINSKFVELIDFRGLRKIQNRVYEDCYTKHCNEYDWFVIIDCDEFLEIGKFKNIKELLSQDIYKNFDGVRFQWKNMNDNNQITVINNDYSLKKRFPNGKMSLTGKSIVRGGLNFNKTEFNGHLFMNDDYRYCDATGKPCISKHVFNKDGSFRTKAKIVQMFVVKTDLYFTHYTSKTIQEWINIKMKRLYPDRDDKHTKLDLTLDTFFNYNQDTPQKRKFAHDYILKCDMYNNRKL